MTRSRTRWPSVVFLGAALFTPAILSAQSYRSVSASRLVMGEKSLRVDIEFAAGKLRVTPGDGRTLYQGEIFYDEGKFQSITDYDARTHTLHFGLKTREGSGKLGRLEHPQRLDLSLAPQVPTALTTSLGAAEAEIELGGLSLTSVEINSGAAQALVNFSQPNRVDCSALSLGTGAAELRVESLGNARCEKIRFAGGVGDVTLDFTGEWSEETAIYQADIKLGLGQLTLRFPKNIGVAIEVDRFLASFDRAGLSKAGSSYLSHGYDAAKIKLHIALKAVLGDIDIEWVER